jgi:hypothetical protein
MQELLLRAALNEGEPAREAFVEWKQATGFAQYADVDFLSTYLLPCVYGNLARSGTAEPWLAQMAGLHRYHWAQNAARQRTLIAVAERLHASGLQFVLWGGFALWAGRYLDDLGQRPRLDWELLLAPSDGLLARRMLTSLGWRASTAALPPVAGWRSEGWHGPEDRTIQVHFRWLPKPYPVVGIGRLLRHARVVDLGGLPLYIPDATDLLLQACVGGRRFQGCSAGRFLWVADAVRILRGSRSELDWDRLLRESRPLCTLFALREALEYLRAAFDAPIPDAWLAEAWEVNIPRSERRPFERLVKRRSSSAARLAMLRRPLAGYVAAEQAAGRTPSAGGLLHYFAWRASLRMQKATRFARGASAKPFASAIAAGETLRREL